MPKLSTKRARKTKSSSTKSVKRVYFFGNGKAEGGAHLKDLLGGKGANLADMTLVPLPVPPGFTITTETCGQYNDLGQKLPRGLMDEVRANLLKLEKATGKKFGDAEQSAARVRPIRREDLHARHDGHRPEHRPERSGRRGPGQSHRQRTLRLRQLSPAHQHVRRHRHGRGSPSFRARADGRQELPRRQAGHRPRRRRAEGSRRAIQESLPSNTSARIFRRTRWCSSSTPSKPSSRAGWATGRSNIAS